MIYYINDPAYDDRDFEQESRQENRLLWEVVDGIEQKAKRSGVSVDWTDDYYDRIVIGHYEMIQGVYGSHDFKCVKIQPHSGLMDMGKFALCFEEAEEACAFFEAHISALEDAKKAVAI